MKKSIYNPKIWRNNGETPQFFDLLFYHNTIWFLYLKKLASMFYDKFKILY